MRNPLTPEAVAQLKEISARTGISYSLLRIRLAKGQDLEEPPSKTRSKLSAHDIAMIQRDASRGVLQCDLAAQYGVSSTTIRAAIKGRIKYLRGVP